MKILSLFDGISVTRQALDNLGVKVYAYYASEIDDDAVSTSFARWGKEVIQIGDITKIRSWEHGKIDLLTAGFPCQDLSICNNKRKGLKGARSGLFWEAVRVLKLVKPRFFIFENVASMHRKDRDVITAELGVEPIMIDASLVSAQHRKRLYWTNIKVAPLVEEGIKLRDVVDWGCKDTVDVIANVSEQECKQSCERPQQLTERRTAAARLIRKEFMKRYGRDWSPRRAKELVARTDGKANCLTTACTKESYLLIDGMVRCLTVIECERLQGLPDDYTHYQLQGENHYIYVDFYGKKFTSENSWSVRWKLLGNAFNCAVVEHIISGCVFDKKTVPW